MPRSDAGAFPEGHERRRAASHRKAAAACFRPRDLREGLGGGAEEPSHAWSSALGQRSRARSYDGDSSRITLPRSGRSRGGWGRPVSRAPTRPPSGPGASWPSGRGRARERHRGGDHPAAVCRSRGRSTAPSGQHGRLACSEASTSLLCRINRRAHGPRHAPPLELRGDVTRLHLPRTCSSSARLSLGACRASGTWRRPAPRDCAADSTAERARPRSLRMATSTSPAHLGSARGVVHSAARAGLTSHERARRCRFGYRAT